MKKTLVIVTLSFLLTSSATIAQERTGDAALGALSGALVLGQSGGGWRPDRNESTAWQIEAALPEDGQITPALKTSPSLDAFIAKLSLQMGLPVTDQHAILAAAMPPRYGQTGIDPGGWRATSLPAVSVQRFRPCLQEL
jgi:hypothetical protein